MERNITFNKPGLALEWSTLKPTANYNRRTLEKKDEKARLRVQELSVREKETVKSDSGADRGDRYKKSSTQSALRIGEQGREGPGRRLEAGFGAARASTGDANAKWCTPIVPVILKHLTGLERKLGAYVKREQICFPICGVCAAWGGLVEGGRRMKKHAQCILDDGFWEIQMSVPLSTAALEGWGWARERN